MTSRRRRLWHDFVLLALLGLAATAALWAADYVDVPLAGQTLARLSDPGKFPALADRAAKVEEALAQVLSTQDLKHPAVQAQQDKGIWVVYAGPVRVLSVLPKDALGAKLPAKDLAEMWAANLKRLLPLAKPLGHAGTIGTTPPATTTTTTTSTPATGATPAATGTVTGPSATPGPQPPAGAISTPPSALPTATVTTTTTPASTTPPATTVVTTTTVSAPTPMTQSAAVLVVLDALNSARATPEDQYLAKRQKLAADLLAKLNAFFTGQPLPATVSVPAGTSTPPPATVITPPATPITPPATVVTPPPATNVTLPPATPSAIAVPADWNKLPIETRLKKKFELATKPYLALEASDPERYQQAGNLLSAARAAKAAAKWEESEGYLDAALQLMGIKAAGPAARSGRAAEAGWALGLMGETPACRAVLVDLDRTLYPPEAGLQEAGDRLLNEWIAGRLAISLDQVDAVRRRLWSEYGTSARGLQVEYGIAQTESYGNTIERLVPAEYVWPRPEVAAMLAGLDLPVYVFTNSTRLYCGRVLAALELPETLFTGIITIETMNWQAKPHEEAYRLALEVANVAAAEALFVDDSVVNLEGAAEYGLPAVLCHPHPKRPWTPHITDIVDLPEVLIRL